MMPTPEYLPMRRSVCPLDRRRAGITRQIRAMAGTRTE